MNGDTIPCESMKNIRHPHCTFQIPKHAIRTARNKSPSVYPRALQHNLPDQLSTVYCIGVRLLGLKPLIMRSFRGTPYHLCHVSTMWIGKVFDERTPLQQTAVATTYPRSSYKLQIACHSEPVHIIGCPTHTPHPQTATRRRHHISQRSQEHSEQHNEHCKWFASQIC